MSAHVSAGARRSCNGQRNTASNPKPSEKRSWWAQTTSFDMRAHIVIACAIRNKNEPGHSKSNQPGLKRLLKWKRCPRTTPTATRHGHGARARPSGRPSALAPTSTRPCKLRFYCFVVPESYQLIHTHPYSCVACRQTAIARAESSPLSAAAEIACCVLRVRRASTHEYTVM